MVGPTEPSCLGDQGRCVEATNTNFVRRVGLAVLSLGSEECF